MVLKGVMTIELTDETTGAVETVMEENMITEAVNNILGLNPMGIFYAATGQYDSSVLWNGNLLPICPNMIGGILLFSKALTEDAANIYEISDELAAKAMILAKKMARVMTDALHCDGFNIVQNNGECAGQTVFHFHMHLIPRYNGDSVGITWTPGTLTDEAKEEILEKVKAQFS